MNNQNFYSFFAKMYSFSQLKLYQQCQKKFAFKYLWNVLAPDDNVSIAGLEGNLLHSALCRLYEKVQNYQTPPLEALISGFKQYWQEEFSEKNHIDGEDPFIVQAYQNCEKILRDYYQKYTPFDQEMVIALEKNLILYGETFTIQTKPDKITKKGDTFILYDYKTNQKLSSEEEMFHREQLLLYALAVKENYGKYFSKLEGCLHYLRLDKEIRFDITDEMLDQIAQKYFTLCQEIESKKEKKSDSEELFPAKEGNLCRFCEFANFCKKGETGQTLSSSYSTEQYAKRYLDTKQKEKALKEEKELLKAQILDIAQKNDFLCVYGNHSQITLGVRKSLKIEDEKEVYNILEKKGILEECLTLNEKEVKDFIASHPDWGNFLEEREIQILKVQETKS